MNRYKIDFYDDVFDGNLVDTFYIEGENLNYGKVNEITYCYAIQKNLYRTMEDITEEKEHE